MGAPGTWTNIPLPFGNTGGTAFAPTFVQLLSDGSVIFVGASGETSWLLEPDQTGNYENPIWTNLGDAPFVGTYGGQVLLNDGKLMLLDPEFSTDAPTANRQNLTWDPTTNSYEILPAFGRFIDITDHPPSVVLDDGTLCVPNRVWRSFHDPFEQDTGANAGLQSNMLQVTADGRTASPLNPPGFGNYRYGSPSLVESHLILLPDGRVLSIGGSYSSVGAGSYNLLGPGTSTQVLPSADPNFFAILDTAGGTRGRWQLYPYSAALNADRPSWQPSGSRTAWSDGNIFYEWGGLAFTPKLNKAVLVSGQGELLVYDVLAATPSVSVGARLPAAPTGYVIGLPTVPAAWVGKTVQEVITENAGFNVTSSAYASFFSSGPFWLANGRSPLRTWISRADGTDWGGFDYSGLTVNSGTNQVVMTGLSTPASPPSQGKTPRGNLSMVIQATDVFCANPPNVISMDANCLVLPSGDLMFTAGQKLPFGVLDGGFVDRSQWYTWDCSGAPAPIGNRDTAGLRNQTVEFGNSATLLPTGQVMVATKFSFISIYTPTNAQLTPGTGWAPTLTNVPTRMDAGTTHTIVGTQLTGLTEGGYFGDDKAPRSNFPIPRWTRVADGRVWYGRSFDFTYRGIAPGRSSSCKVTVPPELPAGSFNFQVVTNGIPSASVPVTNGTEPPTVNASGYTHIPTFLNPFGL